jgi:hypothetical protein
MADFGGARRVAEAAGDQFRVYLLNLIDGYAHSQVGDSAAGRVLVEAGLRFAEKIGTVFVLAMGKAWLAACAVALGDGAAPALSRDALLLAEKTSDRQAQAVAYRALAEALAQDRAAPDRARAEEAMAQSIRLFKEIEFNPELARTYVSYAGMLQGWGEDAQAKSYLTQAIAMFQAMDMEWDLARAKAMLTTGTPQISCQVLPLRPQGRRGLG